MAYCVLIPGLRQGCSRPSGRPGALPAHGAWLFVDCFKHSEPFFEAGVQVGLTGIAGVTAVRATAADLSPMTLDPFGPDLYAARLGPYASLGDLFSGPGWPWVWLPWEPASRSWRQTFALEGRMAGEAVGRASPPIAAVPQYSAQPGDQPHTRLVGISAWPGFRLRLAAFASTAGRRPRRAIPGRPARGRRRACLRERSSRLRHRARCCSSGTEPGSGR